MGFRELIKRVQHYSGFSDKESKDALEHMIESKETDTRRLEVS